MSDDLDDLKAAMTSATPAPDAARRAENLALARQNFETLQGSAKPLRPTSENGQNALWTGVKTMLNTLTSKGALGATTALVACGFLFLTPTGQDLLRKPAPKTVKQETESAAKTVDTLRRATPQPVPARPKASSPLGELLTDHSGAAGLTATTSPADQPIVMKETPANDLSIMQSSDTEAFANAAANPIKVVTEEPVSTFSIDVDTATYSVVRSSLQNGSMPPHDAVRVEEMINYFPYEYAGPEVGEAPFRPTVTVMGTPWKSARAWTCASSAVPRPTRWEAVATQTELRRRPAGAR